MERPQGNIEPAVDEYDNEITQIQADGIALADELLTHKAENSPLTFVDMVVEGNKRQMLEELQQGPFGDLLTAPDEQLAIPSDGSYYPVLDIRKENGKFVGIGVRAYGWDQEKYRFTNDSGQFPHELKYYEGEIDKAREIDVTTSYKVGDEYVSETLSLYFSTAGRTNITASSQLHMMAYAETGYEGHGGKRRNEVSEEDAYWFLEYVARHVGDEPKSIGEYQEEKIQEIRADAERHGVLDVVDELIQTTWNAQALGFMTRPCKALENKQSVAEALRSPETAEQGADVLRKIIAAWNEKRR